MPLVDVEHARNAPLITDLLGRCAVRNVLMPRGESMTTGAKALLASIVCSKSEYVVNYNDCCGSIRALTHIRERLNGATGLRQIIPIRSKY